MTSNQEWKSKNTTGQPDWVLGGLLKSDKMQCTVLNIFQSSFFFTLTLKKSETAWANFPVINSFIQYEAFSKRLCGQ